MAAPKAGLWRCATGNGGTRAGGTATARKLTDFPRRPFKTDYLQKDGEPKDHLVNEPFDYDKVGEAGAFSY